MKLLPCISYILLGVVHITFISFLFPIHSVVLFVLTVLVLIVIYVRGAIKDDTKWIWVGVVLFSGYLATNSWLAPPTIELKDMDTYDYSLEELFDRK